MVMPSPLESSKKVKPLLQEIIHTNVQVTTIKEESVNKKDGLFLTTLNLTQNVSFFNTLIVKLIKQFL